MDAHGATPETAELVAWIRSRTLPTTRLREGYWIQEVDGLLAAICDDLLRGVPVGPERVGEARFTPVRMVTGYDQGATDVVLAELQQRLGDPTPAPSPPPSPAPARSPSQADRDLATWVAQLRFATSRRPREGYDQGQVDRFLAGVRTDLETGGPRPDARRVRTAGLDRVRRVPGYDLADVDTALDELVDRLEGAAPRPVFHDGDGAAPQSSGGRRAGLLLVLVLLVSTVLAVLIVVL